MSSQRRRRRSPLPFLILNIIISALTTLLVLWLWNRTHNAAFFPAGASQEQANTLAALSAATPSPLPPFPALDHPVLEIENVFGMGDIENEVVIIRRVGDEQEIWLKNWSIRDENGNSYIFESLVLNIDAEVHIYSKAGFDKVSNLYWGLNQAIWQTGETVTIIDSLGNIRATFEIP